MPWSDGWSPSNDHDQSLYDSIADSDNSNDTEDTDEDDDDDDSDEE